MEILQIKNLDFTYPGEKIKTLENISFSVLKGSINLLIGATGSGKSTLLRLIKTQIRPVGQTSGKIIFETDDILTDGTDLISSKIGFVGQDPDQQIVTDKVWSELVFGPENMGIDSNDIHIRAAEISSYFGIDNWYENDTDKLSGGQKQILNLASVMITQPDILILDEPTSQLDPVSASAFISTLVKLNTEFGTTVLIAEHRTEDLFHLADKLLILDKGKLIFDDTPLSACTRMKGHYIYDNFPASAKLWSKLDIKDLCPLCVKDGIKFLEKNFYPSRSETITADAAADCLPVVQTYNLWFRYSKNEKDILKGAAFTVQKGETYSILGSNGSGKTTILNLISGLVRPYRGCIKINGKKITEYKNNTLYRGTLAFLPQDPKLVFINDTVEKDLIEAAESLAYSYQNTQLRTAEIIDQFEIKSLIHMHPYDLSGGERQICAIAKLMISDPQIILLDEPTKGLDSVCKKKLGSLLEHLKKHGKTVIIATHDIEFSAQYSDKCALLFNGNIVCSETPLNFFAKNLFYTTAFAAMSKNIFNDTILLEDVVKRCQTAKRK